MSRYKIFHVGGDPARMAFLASELSEKVNKLQQAGWTIVGVDPIINYRAWYCERQMYVEVTEYIIRATKDN